MVKSILVPDDPPAVRALTGADPRLVLVCDHASNRIPSALDDLGLDGAVLGRHVAHDLGAGRLAAGLAERLDAPAVLAGYSRLVIDLNRDPASRSSVPSASDGILIPANHAIDETERTRRRVEFFDPYHEAVADAIDAARHRGVEPAVVGVHSFTPALSDGVHRPWHIGLLWRHDDRLVRPLLEDLRREEGLAVGDNEPYSGHVHEGYTLPHHAERSGLPHVLLEVRDDQLATDEGVDRWIDRLGRSLGAARGRLVPDR